MSDVLKLAQKPAIGITRDTSLRKALELMRDERIGAVVVLEGGHAAGIFSERDLMCRVVLAEKTADGTTVGDVMTAPVLTVRAGTEPTDAMSLMLEKHIRHLPVVDEAGTVLGMLSIRHLMCDLMDELKDRADAAEAYMTYDGATG